MTTAVTLPVSVVGVTRGVNFWEVRSFTGAVCACHVLLPRAHFIKEHFYVIHDCYYVIQAPL
jgi:hypothetical protein